jgi:putative membrane protein
MMQSPRFQRALKALLLIAMGLFLYRQIVSGTLYFYISDRYTWLTFAAFIGFIVVGLSYRWSHSQPHAHDLEHDLDHDHGQDHGQDHEQDHGHDHSHGLGWLGAILVATPILLGLLVPPQPLGASALSTREMSVGSVDSVMPAAVRMAAEKAATDRNILDWVLAFQEGSKSGERFAGVEADVVGFVYRTGSEDPDTFWAARFVVNCCVADATPVGLLVRWPQHAQLEEGAWVQVTGRLAEEVGRSTPVLIADAVESVAAPRQPYLYP